MERIVLTHLSGSKKNLEDRFPLDRFKEITLGRDPSSSVRFNQETEAIVGRQHARITRNPALPSLFLITDLGSRNGTFVNGQRIFGTSSLKHGDVVQCGAGGPEFRFDVELETDQIQTEPPPRPTVDLPDKTYLRPTRLDPPYEEPSDPAPEDAARVEWASAPADGQSRKRAIVGGGVLMGLIALAAGLFAYRNIRSNSSNVMEKTEAAPQQNASPDADAEKYGHAHLTTGADIKKDSQRAAWRLEVAPYLALGSGRPGDAASDFDQPAGVAFSPAGLLFATDDRNRRVQIWDVKTGSRLGEFGADVFGGEIADITITPDNRVLVVDRARGLAYDFSPPLTGAPENAASPLSTYDYRFKDARFGEQGFVKLGGFAIDSKGRSYLVDALHDDILRFNPDGAPDGTWKFEKTRTDGAGVLNGCGAIAIDEAGGNLFAASENNAIVEVFDWETGAYKHRFVGAGKDASGKPSGNRVFFGPVRGMTVVNRRLLAVDESAGRIQIFDLARPDVFNTDLTGYGAPQPVRAAGYQGFFGDAPIFDFEDVTNTELQQKVKAGSIIPGRANPPGHFCSPGSIASHTDKPSGETYIAIADKCNYRVVVYRWSEIARALGVAETPTDATLAAKAAETQIKPAPAGAAKTAGAIKSAMAPVTRRGASNRIGKGASAGSRKTGSRSGGRITNAVKRGATTTSGKNKQRPSDVTDSTVSGKKAKKAKKAKKEKKVKY